MLKFSLRDAPPSTSRIVAMIGLTSALEMKRIATDGVIEGYASLFERADLGGDVMARGAFSGSLRRRGAVGIKMLFQHDPHQPVGVWDVVREDARGLYVRGRLTLEVARAREVWALLKAGALDGLSIGFKTVEAEREKRSGTRRLTAVDLWEISIVTFPMLPDARVSAVKGVSPVSGMLARLTREMRGVARVGPHPLKSLQPQCWISPPPLSPPRKGEGKRPG